MEDYPNQNWVDITSETVRNIMTARLQLAADKGCDVVEMDHVDAYQQNTV